VEAFGAKTTEFIGLISKEGSQKNCTEISSGNTSAEKIETKQRSAIGSKARLFR
jgi:hypothetical protein